MDLILNRRSIRKYKEEQVSEEILRKILLAAMSAPSAGNQKPWHFVVINNREILDKIPEFHPYAQMLKQAPAAILVCGDESLEKFKGFWVQDCSAAVQNILLAAQAEGLGAVWAGIYPEKPRMEGMTNLLNLPQNAIPFALIPLGYPNETKPAHDIYDETRVHFNHW